MVHINLFFMFHTSDKCQFSYSATLTEIFISLQELHYQNVKKDIHIVMENSYSYPYSYCCVCVMLVPYKFKEINTGGRDNPLYFELFFVNCSIVDVTGAAIFKNKLFV